MVVKKGVVNELPVAMLDPPLATSYHFTGSFALAVINTVPFPQVAPGTPTGSSGMEKISALTTTLWLEQVEFSAAI